MPLQLSDPYLWNFCTRCPVSTSRVKGPEAITDGAELTQVRAQARRERKVAGLRHPDRGAGDAGGRGVRVPDPAGKTKILVPALFAA